MKRAWLIVAAGVLLAAAAYCGLYYTGTANCHSMMQSSTPELAWLRGEFKLSDAEFSRISKIHESYLAGCAERCRLIDAKNERLRGLLAQTNTVTPEIEKTLADAAQLRAECQKQMLQEFYEVSRTMPPDQGKRYLEWMQEQTVLPNAHSQMHH
jgi:hypothetical protein